MSEREAFDSRLAVECADAFAQACGIGCVVSLAGGDVVHGIGYSCAACAMCRAAGLVQEKCVQSQNYGMAEAERFGGKYVYFCPLGLTCFVSPILGSEGGEARITVGPFLMVERADFAECDLAGRLCLAGPQLAQACAELEKVPVVSAEKVNSLSTLLFMSVGFMNNVSAANRMLETQDSDAIQGQITAYIQQLKGLGGEAKPYPFDTERALLKAIAQSDKPEAQRLLNELFGYIFFVAGGDFEQAKSRIYELLVLISRTAIDAGADPEGTLKLSHTYLQTLPRLKDVDALCLWLTGVMEKYIDSVFNYMDAKHADAIHRAIQYLRRHCAEKVTLNEMAAMTYLSPAYFSRIFKSETGVSFSQFLTGVRVEKAKDLLVHGSERLTDIALACGFEDQSYFTKVFKKVAGIAPLKYRDRKGGLMK